MKDREPRRLEMLRVALRIARGGGDELDALLDHELDNVRVANKGLRDIHAKGLVRERSHLDDLFANLVELARRRFNDAEGARIGDGGCKARTRDPSHGRLHNRNLDAKHFGDAIGECHAVSFRPDQGMAHMIVASVYT